MTPFTHLLLLRVGQFVGQLNTTSAGGGNFRGLRRHNVGDLRGLEKNGESTDTGRRQESGASCGGGEQQCHLA